MAHCNCESIKLERRAPRRTDRAGEIVTVAKIARGDFSFRVERATLARSNPNPGVCAVRTRVGGAPRHCNGPGDRPRSVHRRYGTLDIPIKP